MAKPELVQVPMTHTTSAATAYQAPLAWETEYGFQFGPMEVRRIALLPDGRVLLTVKTPFQEIEIYASRTGRSLRAFRKGKGEMKP